MSRRRRPGEGTIWVETLPNNTRRYRIRAQIRLPDGSVRVVNASGPTQASARHKFAVRKRQVELEASKIDVGSLHDRVLQWLDEKELDVSARTLHQYRQKLDYVLPILGHKPLHEVTTSEIQAVLNDLRKRGVGPTADYVRRVLKQMFSHAVRDGYLETSPMNELRGRNVRSRLGLDAAGNATTRLSSNVWTPQEVRTFLESLEGNRLREMFVIALFTGVRRGEILTLRWEDIGPDDSYVHVQRAFNEYEPNKVGPPKSVESVRKIPLGQIARDAISIARQRREYERRTVAGYCDEGWVFPSRAGTMLNGRNYYRQFKRAIQWANEQAAQREADGETVTYVKDIRLHGLRHTFATYLARQGHSPAVIQRLLGHSTPYLALKVYTHVMEEDLLDVTLELSDVIN